VLDLILLVHYLRSLCSSNQNGIDLDAFRSRQVVDHHTRPDCATTAIRELLLNVELRTCARTCAVRCQLPLVCNLLSYCTPDRDFIVFGTVSLLHISSSPIHHLPPDGLVPTSITTCFPLFFGILSVVWPLHCESLLFFCRRSTINFCVEYSHFLRRLVLSSLFDVIHSRKGLTR